MIQVKSILPILGVLLFSYQGSFSQSYAPLNWYFGNSSNSIRFKKSDSSPVVDPFDKRTPFGTVAAATVTNPDNGNLVFYTDGQKVYDHTHTVIPSLTAASLSANPNFNQGVVVVSVPGNNDQYFIITNNGSIRYSIFDLTIGGNSTFPGPTIGDLSTVDQAIPVSTGAKSEAMLVIAKPDLSGYWLITQDAATADYKVLDINGPNPTGWTESTYSMLAAGSPLLTAANISYSNGSMNLAVAPIDDNINIQLLNFDPTTGMISYNIDVLNSANLDVAGAGIFDTEWSPNGQYLFVSKNETTAGTGELLVYDLLNSATTARSLHPSTLIGSYGIQTGPDGEIYHLYEEAAGSFQIGSFVNFVAIDSIVYTPQVLGPENYLGSQFPSTMPDRIPNLVASFTYAGTCANTNISFFPSVIPSPDSVEWNFGNGNTSNLLSPINIYTAGGSFPGNLRAYLNGQFVDAPGTINITNFDAQLTLVQDTVACECEFPEPKGNRALCPDVFTVTVQAQSQSGGAAPSLNYVWSNGQTGPDLVPDSSGYYYVVATDPISGCSAYAGVNVEEFDEPMAVANVWYFGNQAGLDFNNNQVVALDDSQMTAPEGCSAISDQNGEIIFYTDGVNVFDKNHVQINNNMGGNTSSAQSALIVPFPNDETLFYVFMTEAVYGGGLGNYNFGYSVFDIKARSGDGDIIHSNISLFSRSTERMTTNDNWVIIHEYGNNTLRAYPITQNGIGTPVLSTFGAIMNLGNEPSGQGYMKLSPDGSRLAMAYQDGATGNNYVEVFQFDQATGEFTDYSQIDLTADGASGQVYGVAFSPGGNKLFATVKNPGASQIFEYRADSLNRLNFRQIMNATGELGAIQTGPNSQLYVAINTSNSLGTISANEDTTFGSNSTYIPASQPLAPGTNSTLGLPTFTQSMLNPPSQATMSVSNPVCVNQTISLNGTPVSVIDEFEWRIIQLPGLNNIFYSTSQSDTTSISIAGDYEVSLHVFNRCNLDTTITQIITVNDVPGIPPIPPYNVAALCNGTLDLPASDGSDPTLSFVWSTGETTQTITVATPGTYIVDITNTSGCTTNAQFFIADGTPFLDLGPDFTVCENAIVTDFDAINPGASYTWTVTPPSGIPVISSIQTQPVDTSIPGDHTYEVSVIDPLTLCERIEVVVVTVNPEPTSVLVANPTTGCGVSDGSFDLQVTTNGNYTFSWSGPAAGTSSLVGGPASPVTTFPPTLDLPTGTYTITITNDVSACISTLTSAIVDGFPLFSIDSATPQTGCGDLPIDIVLIGATGANPSYTLTNTTTSVATTGAGAGLSFSTTPVPAGNYLIDVVDTGGSGCTVAFGPVAVVENPRMDLSFVVDECSVPPSIIASSTTGTPIFTWDAALTSAGNTAQTSIGGNYSLTVSDIGGAFCDSTVVVTVNALPLHNVSIISVGNPCSGLVQANAQVDQPGNYSYSWSNGAVGPAIALGTVGTYNLTVSVSNQATGCVVISPQETIDVREPISITVATSAACADGNPFTVEAITQPSDNVVYVWRLNGSLIPNAIASTWETVVQGEYTVEATRLGCMATDVLDIALAPTTQSFLPSAFTFCPDDGAIDLDPANNFSTYLWSDGSSASTLSVASGGLYTVDMTNSFGCSTSDQTEVLEDCIPKVFGPNAFKPGGVNPEFFLYTEYLENFEISIFNRWGEMVFFSDQPNFTWNGTKDGTLLPPGQYSYVTRYTSSFNPLRGQLEQHGGVVLLR